MLVSAMIRTTTPIAILATVADPQEDDERLFLMVWTAFLHSIILVRNDIMFLIGHIASWLFILHFIYKILNYS